MEMKENTFGYILLEFFLPGINSKALNFDLELKVLDQKHQKRENIFFSSFHGLWPRIDGKLSKVRHA